MNLDSHVYTLSATNPVTIGQLSSFPSLSGRLTISDGTVAVSDSSASFEVGINRAGCLTVTTDGLLAGTGMSLFVGRGNNGTFTVNGGDVLANHVNIGASSGSIGTSTISGTGSAVFSSRLTVGERGTGTLTASDRGQIESNSADIGEDLAGIRTIHVNGPGSKWDNSGALTIGSRGTGTPNTVGGGRVECGSGGVGMEGNSHGTLNISDIDSIAPFRRFQWEFCVDN